MNLWILNAIALVAALILSTILCAVLIPVLHKIKFGQQIREEGPEAHLKKAGTPTMGGIAFLFAILIVGLVMIIVTRESRLIPVLLMTMLFGLIGFLDDWLKVAKKQSEGLNPKQKLFMQFVFTLAFAVYLVVSGIGCSIIIPFTGYELQLPRIVYVIFVFLVVLGTDNGVNFTDGLDGLCSSVTVFVAAFFGVAAWKLDGGISTVCFAVCGALIGFLIFNHYPARVFMGDTGSLALGAFVSSAALVMRIPLFIIIVGLIYLIEVLSVIIQVTYFKKTGGKRIFRMAPIHHHFELGGWSEVKVVAVFSLVTLALCVTGYFAL